MHRVRVTEIGEVESYEYTVSARVQQAVKAPLFEEFKNCGEMLTREMCFMPALTLTTWLREVYSIQPITVATASRNSPFSKLTRYVTFFKLASRKIGLKTVLDKVHRTIVKVVGYVPVLSV